MVRSHIAALALLAASSACMADNTIARHKNPAHLTEAWAREFAESIELRGDVRTLLLSGVGPLVANPSAPAGTVAAYGDTAAQTRSVLQQIQQSLQQRGYGLGDIVSMQVFIVGDPGKGGEPDFGGFSSVYNQYFGTAAQPHVPTRTRAQVLRLVPPGWLVEVTVTAARSR